MIFFKSAVKNLKIIIYQFFLDISDLDGLMGKPDLVAGLTLL